ncbi:hypothetical protein DFJ58DRAFT_720220 [Suillus subalutaceus]|uniref:uncharacterized protein n=1 Tax=Suillus subalutaceus TaxID=48586 RepID=UPI001B85B6A9|nr:uncharacterized protein DFJ58DRAFT_720220 [Suillus subalutaceus]KAG1818359.1 hypothetical protein DFJ58DRAFT_720220 [Suillus subalutaceus]
MAYYSNSPVVHNGPPTLLHYVNVRDAKDAHVVLEAVRLNMLPKKQLSSSGNVFVWEEAENDGGLLRWTDGRRWSQSRMRGDYLFYEEKMETTQEEKDAKAAIRALRTTDPLAVAPPTNRRKDRPNRPNGLTKQTYSALVYLPGSSLPRKWHVVAYFTGDDYVRLPVIESYDYLRNLRVPGGIFVSSKANGSRTDRFSYTTDGIEPYNSASHGHGHPSQYSMLQGVPRGPMSPASSSSSIPFIPYPASFKTSTVIGRRNGTWTCRDDTPESRQPHSSPSVQLGHPSPTTYSPLSAEDRRVLNSFKVVL